MIIIFVLTNLGEWLDDNQHGYGTERWPGDYFGFGNKVNVNYRWQ